MNTYRLQLHAGFRFEDARAIVPYLHRLGITHLYSSPILRALSGSRHGYDVVDPTTINPEIGTEDELRDLSARLQAHDMGWIVDIVPNHMAARSENRWWMDVLQKGHESQWARLFDVNWESETARELRHRILLPILGRPYGDALEQQEIRIALEDGGFFVRYWERKLPLNLRSYARILRQVLEGMDKREAGFDRLAAILASLEKSPDAEESPDSPALQHQRRDLLAEEPAVSRAVARTLELLNGRKGEPSSFDALDEILEQQAYRLAFWRMAAEEINYRRFFDISDLISVRVNDPAVFAVTHEKILALVDEGIVQGLRIDHIDGLYDPAAYLKRLRDETSRTGRRRRRRKMLIVVEKILAEDELLPDEFAVCGTTGYDFLGRLEQLFVEPEGFRRLEELFREITGIGESFEDIARESKKQAMRELFAGEIRNFGQRLAVLAARDRRARDIPPTELRQALVEVIASLPVYRTYIRDRRVPPRDRRILMRALDDAQARRSEGGPGATAFGFLRRLLLLDPPPQLGRQIAGWVEVVRRWQQLTGPITAKGVEDTALYRFNPLVALNDVGCEPVLHRPAVDAFHERNATTAERCPWTMNTTSTHDTKRSEDVRARLNVLSEIPEVWARHLARWRRRNRAHRQSVGGRIAPDPNEELLLYQMLVGAWPLAPSERSGFRSRIRDSMVKAMREAKVNTRWTRVDTDYENAVTRFVDAILSRSRSERFLADLEILHRRVSFFGALNSLSQLLLKIASPGITDLYQGTELWEFSLVDPDNRRRVDFTRRQRMLDAIIARDGGDPELLRELMVHWEDGRIKLFLTWKGCTIRNQSPDRFFVESSYHPLAASGARADHLVAFARARGTRWAIAIAPRFMTRLVSRGRFPLGQSVWRDTFIRLPPEAPSRWRNELTGELLSPRGGAIEVAEALRSFPVALLKGLED